MVKWFKYLSGSLLLMTAMSVEAGVRVHNEEDSIKAMRYMEEIKSKGGDFGDRIVTAATLLEGVPRTKAPDNDSIGTVVVCFDGFDSMGFVNNVMALAMASGKTQPGFKDFEESLVKISRRKGEDDGFVSKLLYASDWIVDNVYRGNVKEMTEYITGGDYRTKTLDYVTRHRDEFPALQDPDAYDRMRMIEMGYRSHRIPHLKKQSISNKSIKELMRTGDIIIMSAPEEGIDLYDIGFVEMKDGEPYLIHLSPDTNVVTVDSYPLSRLFKLQGQYFYGYRWLRPTE